MDSRDTNEDSDSKKKPSPHLLFRIPFPLLSAFFLLSFLLGLAAILLGGFSIPNLISVPSRCKIVSSSVDLRSARVCEVGFLKYKAKNVFHPSEKNKYRCRYEYYWASVFKVEYKDPSSGQTRLAFTEAPDEALPLDCRPDFSVAWLTKDRFKVNETYNCWYTFGISKVKLYHNSFFGCPTKDTSTYELIELYMTLTGKIVYSWISSSKIARYWRWGTVASAITGFSTPLLIISFTRIIQQTKSRLTYIHLKRVSFLLVYLSFTCWLGYQYWKRLHLPTIKILEIIR